MAILETKNLYKHFDGVAAVDNLSLQFEDGRITGIIGPNGSGKTTLTNLLSGMTRFDKGSVVVGGIDLSSVRRQDVPVYGITRTFQDVRLFNQMTVLDNILVVLTERPVFSALFSRHTGLHLKQAEGILRQVDLWEKRGDRAVNLSYGQRKLLEIARVLAMDAKIVLFDEPFAGLFPQMIKIVVAVMRKLQREGKTIVLIEHNMELIRELCDYIYVMDSGRLLAQGRPSEVLSKPEVIEAYLGE